MDGSKTHRQRRVVFWGTVLLVSLPLSAISATDHYVDKDAGGANNGSSWANAWQSFAAIDWGDIGPGDTIYISGGSASKTYNETLTVGASGTAGQPILITRGGDPGHDGTVILDGQKTLSFGIYLQDDDYVTVRGLEVRDFEGAQIRVRYLTGVVIEDNVIHAWDRASVTLRQCVGAIVRNNRMTTTDDRAVQTDGIYSQLNQGNVYEYNHIVITNDDPTGHNDGIQMYQDTDTTVRFNYIEQDNTKVSNAQGIYATESYGTITAYGNVIYGPNTKNGLLTLLRISAGDARLLAYNNTIVGSGWGALIIENSPGSEAKNNILFCDKTAGLVIRVTSDIDPAGIDYNLYYAPNSSSMAQVDTSPQDWSEWQALGYEAHGQYSDPLLVNVDTRNFRVEETSPAIDAGIALGVPYDVDFDGVSRPQGEGWDRGAYEHGEGTPPIDWVFREDFESGDTSAWSAVFPTPLGEPSQLVPVGVSASDYEVPNAPENTLDEDLGTRWSSLGLGQWIRYDLGTVTTVERIRIAFYIGDLRTASFEIEVSQDDSSWSSVLTGESNGTTVELQNFDFSPVEARYVRYVGYGNSNDEWNSLTEVEIYGTP